MIQWQLQSEVFYKTVLELLISPFIEEVELSDQLKFLKEQSEEQF